MSRSDDRQTAPTPAAEAEVGARQDPDGTLTLTELGSEGATWLKSTATVDVAEWR
jgi:hypothetical protein